jgi:hypothetical protein
MGGSGRANRFRVDANVGRDRHDERTPEMVDSLVAFAMALALLAIVLRHTA